MFLTPWHLKSCGVSQSYNNPLSVLVTWELWLFWVLCCHRYDRGRETAFLCCIYLQGRIYAADICSQWMMLWDPTLCRFSQCWKKKKKQFLIESLRSTQQWRLLLALSIGPRSLSWFLLSASTSADGNSKCKHLCFCKCRASSLPLHQCTAVFALAWMGSKVKQSPMHNAQI